MNPQLKLFQARWILPICGPPICRGWVLADGHRVLGVSGSAPPPSGFPTIDLGDQAIIPGLVNSHTHLEFSELRHPLGSPGIRLNDWIGEVLRWRQTAGKNRQNAIRLGLHEVAAGGAILAGEIAIPPWLVADEPLDVEVVAFAEVLGLTEQRAAERLAQATSLIESLADRLGVTAGVSPHAPYSTSLETTRRAVSIARSRCLGVAMHLGESEAERELLTRGTGGFAKTLATLGVDYAAFADVGEGKHLAYLRVLADSPFALVIHGHDLQEDEIDFIATSPRMTLVYCPRTQAYFGHEPNGFERLVRRGGRIALGTDSRASNPDLSIWNELRWLWKSRPDLPWDRVLRMATIDAADAFLRPDLGRIEADARCGLLALPGDADSVEDLVEQWLDCDSPRWLTK